MMQAPVLRALLWAWSNMKGISPDANTMTNAEIDSYWNDYEALLRQAIADVADGATPEQASKALRTTEEEWQPIETAPYGQALCWIKFPSGKGCHSILTKDEDDNWVDENGSNIAPYTATHWRPLPEPPSAT